MSVMVEWPSNRHSSKIQLEHTNQVQWDINRPGHYTNVIYNISQRLVKKIALKYFKNYRNVKTKFNHIKI